MRTLIEHTAKETAEQLVTKISYSMQDPTLKKIFSWGAEDTDITTPYSQLPVIYACIRARATNLANVPLLVVRGEQVVEKHPVVDLFERINDTMDEYQFIEGVVTSLDTRGNAFIVKDPEVRGGVPMNLYVFHPDWMRAATDRNGVWVGWWLKRGGKGSSAEEVFLERDQVIHLKYYNPYEELLGLSPMGVLRMAYETEWKAARYNRKFFDNDGTPPVVYTLPSDVSGRKAQSFERDLEKRRGVEETSKEMVLRGGVTVQTIGLPQKDMQFLEQRKFTREEVCMVYKVPKSEVTLYEDLNYATARSQDIGFWKKTLIPLGRQVSKALTKGLLEPLGLGCTFDFQAVDALNNELLEKVDAAERLVNMGYPLNMVNDRLSLGFEPVEWGDEPRTFGFPAMELAGRAEVTKAADVPRIPFLGDAPATEGVGTIDKALLAKRWNQLMTPLLPLIGRASKAVRRYFYDVEQRILRQMTKSAEWTAKNISEDDIDWDAILRTFDDEELREAVREHLKGALDWGILSVRGSAFKIDSPEALAVLREKIMKIAEVNDTAQKQVVETLKDTLAEAIEDGVGEAERSRRIIDALAGKMKDIQRRARTIARTEVNSAFSEGRWKSAEITEPKYIRWVSSRDAKVRDSHEYLDGKTVRFGQPFDNGLTRPHDPSGAADEVINCRCTYELLYDEDE